MKKLDSSTPSYFHALDGLRAVGMFFVITFHFARVNNSAFRFEIGWIALQLFFVLSGFLITRILLLDKGLLLKSFLKKFYIRRILRIFPLYFAYLLLIVILYGLFSEPKDFPKYALGLFTYTYNFSILSADWTLSKAFVHLWTLSVEEQFYLVWPFAVYFLSTDNLKKLILILILGVPVFRMLLESYLTSTNPGDQEFIGNAVFWFSFSHFDAFAVGGAVNLIGDKFLGIGKRQWLVLLFLMCTLGGILNGLSLIQLGAFEVSALGYPLHGTYNLQHVWSYTLLNSLFAVTIWNIIDLKNSIFESKPLVFIGKISYGIYIFHFVVLIVLEKTNVLKLPELLSFPIYFGLCTLAGYISYFWFEKRFLALKTKF